MKRSARMEKLHKINLLQEKQAAADFASASHHYEQTQNQLNKLEEYWREYSDRLEQLKKSTSCALSLREHQQFLNKLDEAITQQQAELDKSAAQLEASRGELLERSGDAKKIEKATARIREQEQASERRKDQKEADELYANNR